ncbi:hypothetical protein AC249_AIPGENE16802 [Exaiptasia diaphana]|nr:hypothetical protein AC249_AIPGENE16802 [Exaiptasia diaphana]
MSRSEKLWCIKIESNKAYLFKGGKKLQGARHIVAATAVETNVRRDKIKTLLKIEFDYININGGKENIQFVNGINPQYFNRFGSDDDFQKIDTKDPKELAEQITTAADKLSINSTSTARTNATSSQRTPETQRKRSLSRTYSVDQSTSKKKKKETTSTSQYVKNIQVRCNECRLDDSTHFIPIDKFVIPPKERQIREVDEGFVSSLKTSLKDHPEGNYEPLFVLVKDVDTKEHFDKTKLGEYQYEVLGGTHLTLATKHLNQESPTNKYYKGRIARIYIGLKDEEARWLGAMHNNTGSCRHGLSYKDEVEICRTQLYQTTGVDPSGEPPKPSDTWRDMCSSLLNKPKRNLSEVFTMAQSSGVVWGHFLTVNQKYENGQLKDQKIKNSEIVKGKPLLKQWQLKELCSLGNEDRAFLLQKVVNIEMSLEEMNVAGKQIKLVKPVQEAIVNFFKMERWDEAETKFGDGVSVDKLLRHAVKAFEASHSFQNYLRHLKNMLSSDEVTALDIFDGQQGTKGIALNLNVQDVNQEAASKLPNYDGAFLTIANVTENKEIAQDVVKAVSRLNFTKLTFFNIVLFVDIKDISTVKDVLKKEGAFEIQTGHFFKKQKNNCNGSVLHNVLTSFLIGHWSVSNTLSEEHITGVNANVIEINGDREIHLPLEAYEWLVTYLSKEGATVVDFDSTNAFAFVAALNSGRNSLFLSDKGIKADVISKLIKPVNSNNQDS